MKNQCACGFSNEKTKGQRVPLAILLWPRCSAAQPAVKQWDADFVGSSLSFSIHYAIGTQTVGRNCAVPFGETEWLFIRLGFHCKRVVPHLWMRTQRPENRIPPMSLSAQWLLSVLSLCLLREGIFQYICWLFFLRADT